MRIKEILNEGVTDIVARFYLEASKDMDRFHNPEDVKYKEKNHEYYDEHFKQWFSEEIVPVFTKPTTTPQPEYTNKPKEGKVQSAGYRGQQYALARADIPYDHKVQRYEPDISNLLPSTMDAGKNNRSY